MEQWIFSRSQKLCINLGGAGCEKHEVFCVRQTIAKSGHLLRHGHTPAMVANC